MRFALVAALLLVSSVARAGAPQPTAAEASALAAGDVVIREMPAEDSGVIRVIGFGDLRAPMDAVWSALLDWEGRVAGNPSLRSVAAYRDATATDAYIRFEVARFGFTVVYHNHYRVDRAAGTMVHALDPTMDNDLERSRGTYWVTPSPNNPAWTRLTYDVETAFGLALPGFVRSWLAGAGVRSFLEDMARRSESS